MLTATNIDEVISHLDDVINQSRQRESRIGYFACLYRKMTISVKEGIAKNAFEDGKRMELLDVIFANRYLQAWDAYINKMRCSNAWCAAFDACENNSLIVLQHLVLGINTHINLDLAIAAAETCPGDQIFALQHDFDSINDVIAHLFQSVQDDLTQVWPPLKMLASIANHSQETVLNFNITLARKASWANALILATLQGNDKDRHISTMDNAVVELAQRIINPGFGAHFILRHIADMESTNVKEIINMLYS